MNRINEREYEKVLKNLIIDFNHTIKIRITFNGVGFSYHYRGDKYIIDIPDIKLGFFSKLAFRHEFGHIILHFLHNNSLFNSNRKSIKEFINEFREKHPIFSAVQKIWYWNPAIRYVKKKFGYSLELSYNIGDIAYGNITHGDDELFADAFAAGKIDYEQIS